MMNIIETNQLTKDYGSGKGIFQVDMCVKPGEVYGFLGPNGAGKTTTIRNLMGFIKPDSGSCSILEMDCFSKSAQIGKRLGYLPGEISFIDGISGKKLVDFLADMKGMKSDKKMLDLVDRFELDLSGKVRKMSKGMKQKIGLIVAFMNDPEVIILDEPTSGLDPLMQNRFVDLILEEKKQGKTILMSSHIFEEVERTCDRTAIIREGKIVAVENMESLSNKKQKTIIVKFSKECVFDNKNLKAFEVIEQTPMTLTARVKNNWDDWINLLHQYPIRDIEIQKESLEEVFLHFYGKEDK